MHARVSRFEIPADKLEEDLRRTSETVERVSQMPGNKGVLYLADRQTGKTLAVTFWESESAMRQSEEAANRLRDQSAQNSGGRVAGVERYEVIQAPW